MDVGTCSAKRHKGFNYSDTQHQKRKRTHKSDTTKPRKRERRLKGLNKHNSTGINDLPDCVLISILSRLGRKEAARTSVLSRRWRYLRFYSSGTLVFDNTDMFSSDDRAMFSLGIRANADMDLAARLETLRKRFIAWVNRVLKLHRRLTVDGLTICFSHLRYRCGRRPGYLDKWIYFAMHKQVKTLELNFARYFGAHTYYDFPNVDMLLSHSLDVNKFGFGSLKSLRLTGVDIRDEVVQYFLASCPYLEQLCIRGSESTEKVRVVDPLPNFKVLEISNCINIASLEISVVNLVSCTYQGKQITLPFKEIPNLSELTLGGNFARSFIYEPNNHSSYSAQMVKLTLNIIEQRLYKSLGNPSALPLLTKLEHLELNVESPVGYCLRFFTSLIKASPLLNEFKIKISYMSPSTRTTMTAGFPLVDESYKCRHENLKAVKLSGYVGCSSEYEFIRRLLKIAPSLETVTIDTESEYYEQESWDCPTGRETGERTRMEAKQRAEKLKLEFTPRTRAVLIVT